MSAEAKHFRKRREKNLKMQTIEEWYGEDEKFVYNNTRRKHKTERVVTREWGGVVATKVLGKGLGATSSFADDLSNKCYTESPDVISGFRPIVERRHFYDA